MMFMTPSGCKGGDPSPGAAAWQGIQVPSGCHQHLWDRELQRRDRLQDLHAGLPWRPLCYQDQQGGLRERAVGAQEGGSSP